MCRDLPPMVTVLGLGLRPQVFIERVLLDLINHWPTTSMTRFGEISLFWQNLQSLGQLFEGFLLFGKFWTSVAKFCMSLGKFSLM